MRKNKMLFWIIICSVFFITGCGNDVDTGISNSNDNNTGSSESSIKSVNDLSSKKGSLICSRDAKAGEGMTTAFNYYIDYKNGNILKLHAIEMVKTSNQEDLDIYEDAYNNINKNYNGLKYYDSEVIRTKDSVSRDTVINYEKIDIDKLLAIEGEEDNIIEDGKAKLNTWLDFASKFGTTCSEE